MKSLIKMVLSTTSMLKSDQTGGYSRFSNYSFANLFQDGMDVSTSEPFASLGQVSFFIQLLSNGIKGHALLSVLRDGLIEE